MISILCISWYSEDDVDIFDKTTYNDKFIICPRCGNTSRRHSTATRKVIMTGGRVLHLAVARARCKNCNRFFSNPKISNLVDGRCRFHPEVVRLSTEAAKHMTLEKAVEHMETKHNVKVAASTVHDWTHKHT